MVAAPDFWARDGLPARLLAPLSQAVALIGGWQRAHARPWQAPVPVICVGNLVAGGAGKTPVVLALLEFLTRAGRQPHALSRGHGGRERGPLRVDPARHTADQVGDEPLLLASLAPTWIARDRATGARAAIAAGAGAIVMDDGFQNLSLAPRLALLVVDGGYGFGNGRVLPAGPLREPVARGLARARAVILIGADRHGLAHRCADPRGNRPVLTARLAPVAPERWRGRRVYGFAGIGRPAKFFETLEDLGAEVVGTASFPDHHPYRPADLDRLIAAARATDATLVTTTKDRVRLPAAAPVETLAVRLVWDEPGRIEAMLAELWP